MFQIHICIWKKAKKPQDKVAVKDTVGIVVTDIIVSLRNREFNSFEKLYKAIRERIEVFNSTQCHFGQQSKQTEYIGKYEKESISDSAEVCQVWNEWSG